MNDGDALRVINFLEEQIRKSEERGDPEGGRSFDYCEGVLLSRVEARVVLSTLRELAGEDGGWPCECGEVADHQYGCPRGSE